VVLLGFVECCACPMLWLFRSQGFSWKWKKLQWILFPQFAFEEGIVIGKNLTAGIKMWLIDHSLYATLIWLRNLMRNDTDELIFGMNWKIRTYIHGFTSTKPFSYPTKSLTSIQQSSILMTNTSTPWMPEPLGLSTWRVRSENRQSASMTEFVTQSTQFLLFEDPDHRRIITIWSFIFRMRETTGENEQNLCFSLSHSISFYYSPGFLRRFCPADWIMVTWFSKGATFKRSTLS
jgi:hypothetical protein